MSAIQLSLDDALIVTATEARDVAIDQVDQHAEIEWLDAASTAIHALARRQETLTTDDVWQALEGIEPPHENRAMGAAMLRAARAGWIKATDSYTNSSRVACHARPLRRWASLVF